jgi:hypothetical protein
MEQPTAVLSETDEVSDACDEEAPVLETDFDDLDDDLPDDDFARELSAIDISDAQTAASKPRIPIAEINGPASPQKPIVISKTEEQLETFE